jgi:hypothetical protein
MFFFSLVFRLLISLVFEYFFISAHTVPSSRNFYEHRYYITLLFKLSHVTGTLFLNLRANVPNVEGTKNTYFPLHFFEVFGSITRKILFFNYTRLLQKITCKILI